MARIHMALPALVLALAMVPPPGPARAATTSKPATAAKSTRAARPEVLPWIADDYDRALATARERKLPLFIESWAPW